MDLKPCPYCGSSEINQHYPDEYGHHVCWCGNCGAFGPNDISAEKAREMWNLRRPEAALLEACEMIYRQAGVSLLTGLDYLFCAALYVDWVRARLSNTMKIAKQCNELRKALEVTKAWLATFVDDEWDEITRAEGAERAEKVIEQADQALAAARQEEAR